MVSREGIINLLEVNGIPQSAPTEQIRSVLLGARYSPEEVDSALAILREDLSDQQIQQDGKHKLLSTETLAPEEVQRLLGVSVNASSMVTPRGSRPLLHLAKVLLFWLSVITITAALLLWYMYEAEIGPFYPEQPVAYAE